MEGQSWERVQAEFSHLKSRYFNSAYLGPSPVRAKTKAMDALHREMDPSFYAFDLWKEVPERIRALLGHLLGGVDPERIAHHTSVNEAISHIANGFVFRPGDVVVSFQGDYPSTVLPWMLNSRRRGYDFRLLPWDLLRRPEALASDLPDRTRLVSVSHLRFDTGEKIRLPEIGRQLRERGIFLVIDCSQSFGAEALSADELEPIDVLTGVTYKWLLGPYGHAFSLFSDRALEGVERTHANWLASSNARGTGDLVSYTAESLPGARRFDRGQTPNMLPMAVLESELELLREIGLQAIGSHNRSLMERFVRQLPAKHFEIVTPKEREASGCIVSLRPRSGNPARIAESLLASGFDFSVREGKLRFSFHLFNSGGQVDSLVEALVGSI